jgi:hypothetical protein
MTDERDASMASFEAMIRITQVAHRPAQPAARHYPAERDTCTH